MYLVVAPAVRAHSIALLPGTFNPPTRAHVELARAALTSADAVLFVIPREFPHKSWTGASLEQRLDMLRRLTSSDPRLGVAVSEGGLYIEMAREARPFFPDARIDLVLGRDAAERIATWDYGQPGVFEQLAKEFRLRVAPRCGTFEGAEKLEVPPDCESISATEVRRRIRAGESWHELVPAEIIDVIKEIY